MRYRKGMETHTTQTTTATGRIVTVRQDPDGRWRFSYTSGRRYVDQYFVTEAQALAAAQVIIDRDAAATLKVRRNGPGSYIVETPRGEALIVHCPTDLDGRPGGWYVTYPGEWHPDSVADTLAEAKAMLRAAVA
jgi:hypothetical protein